MESRPPPSTGDPSSNAPSTSRDPWEKAGGRNEEDLLFLLGAVELLSLRQKQQGQSPDRIQRRDESPLSGGSLGSEKSSEGRSDMFALPVSLQQEDLSSDLRPSRSSEDGESASSSLVLSSHVSGMSLEGTSQSPSSGLSSFASSGSRVDQEASPSKEELRKGAVREFPDADCGSTRELREGFIAALPRRGTAPDCTSVMGRSGQGDDEAAFGVPPGFSKLEQKRNILGRAASSCVPRPASQQDRSELVRFLERSIIGFKRHSSVQHSSFRTYVENALAALQEGLPLGSTFSPLSALYTSYLAAQSLSAEERALLATRQSRSTGEHQTGGALFGEQTSLTREESSTADLEGKGSKEGMLLTDTTTTTRRISVGSAAPGKELKCDVGAESIAASSPAMSSACSEGQDAEKREGRTLVADGGGAVNTAGGFGEKTAAAKEEISLTRDDAISVVGSLVQESGRVGGEFKERSRGSGGREGGFLGVAEAFSSTVDPSGESGTTQQGVSSAAPSVGGASPAAAAPQPVKAGGVAGEGEGAFEVLQRLNSQDTEKTISTRASLALEAVYGSMFGSIDFLQAELLTKGGGSDAPAPVGAAKSTPQQTVTPNILSGSSGRQQQGDVQDASAGSTAPATHDLSVGGFAAQSSGCSRSLEQVPTSCLKALSPSQQHQPPYMHCKSVASGLRAVSSSLPEQVLAAARLSVERLGDRDSSFSDTQELALSRVQQMQSLAALRQQPQPPSVHQNVQEQLQVRDTQQLGLLHHQQFSSHFAASSQTAWEAAPSSIRQSGDLPMNEPYQLLPSSSFLPLLLQQQQQIATAAYSTGFSGVDVAGGGEAAFSPSLGIAALLHQQSRDLPVDPRVAAVALAPATTAEVGGEVILSSLPGVHGRFQVQGGIGGLGSQGSKMGGNRSELDRKQPQHQGERSGTAKFGRVAATSSAAAGVKFSPGSRVDGGSAAVRDVSGGAPSAGVGFFDAASHLQQPMVMMKMMATEPVTASGFIGGSTLEGASEPQHSHPTTAQSHHRRISEPSPIRRGVAGDESSSCSQPSAPRQQFGREACGARAEEGGEVGFSVSVPTESSAPPVGFGADHANVDSTPDHAGGTSRGVASVVGSVAATARSGVVGAHPMSSLMKGSRAINRDISMAELRKHLAEFCTDKFGSRLAEKLRRSEGESDERAASDEEDNSEAVLQLVLSHCQQLSNDAFGSFVLQKLFESGSSDQRTRLCAQLSGDILRMSLRTHGCRVVQKAIECVGETCQDRLAEELRGHVIRCVEDQNGNHVIQKCIESMRPNKLRFIIEALRGQVQRLSVHCFGCRVVQRLLEYCPFDFIAGVMEEVMGRLPVLAQDQYGNYVVQHVLEFGRPVDKAKVVELICLNLLSFSSQKFACNVVEKALVASETFLQQAIIATSLGDPACHAAAIALSTAFTDLTGSFGVDPKSTAFDRTEERISGEGGIRDTLGCASADLFETSVSSSISCKTESGSLAALAAARATVLPLATTSKNVDQAFQRTTPSSGKEGSVAPPPLSPPTPVTMEMGGATGGCGGIGGASTLSALRPSPHSSTQSIPLDWMVRDRFGNYVVQRMLQVAKREQRDELLSRLRQQSTALRKFTYGRHIVSALERLERGEACGVVGGAECSSDVPTKTALSTWPSSQFPPSGSRGASAAEQKRTSGDATV